MEYLFVIPCDTSPKTLRWLLQNNLIKDQELVQYVKNNDYSEMYRWSLRIEDLD
jgi:hypothetical protein